MGGSALKLLMFVIVSHASSSQVGQPGISADVVYACNGSTATLPWILRINSRIEFAKYIKWFFNSVNSTDLVAVYTNGQFLQTARYLGRVSHLQDNGISLRHVTVNDSGIYRIESLISQINSSALPQLRNYSLYLQVAATPMIQDGRLRVRQDTVAVWDTGTQQWAIRLHCGAFTFKGLPPITVEWHLAGGVTRVSSGYENGDFYLSLSTPVVPDGRYTCRIPRQYLSQVCLPSSAVIEASVLVDEVRARLTLAEAEQRRLRQDFALLEAKVTNISRYLQASQQDVCSGTINYRTINDFAGVRDLSSSVEGSMCDTNITSGWYRWFLYGQDAIIPTSCTPMRKCGTHATMWIDLKGQPLPAVGREVQGRACAHWDSNCCRWERPSVTVRNCGSYYLYHLGPVPNCSLVYCLQRKI